ncbi:MAG: serine/threonine-protein kinase [Sumerlaeia bacterium]
MTHRHEATTERVTPKGLPANSWETFGSDWSSIAATLKTLGGSPPPPTPELEALDKTRLLDQEKIGWNRDVSTSFTLSRPIGRGGFGEVWEGEQTSLGRQVAIKRLRGEIYKQAGDSESSRQLIEDAFRAEGRTAASLDHPNIVPIYDLGLDAMNRPLLAMKRIEGQTWSDILRDDFRAMEAGEYYAKHIPILADVAQAVAFAHSRNIVHRDLKPSQVMIGEFGEVFLMDWGLAVIVDRADPVKGTADVRSPSGSTSISNPAGTPSFMAPEQTRNDPRFLGPWTDVYLLGAMLYFVLTGSPPHSSGSGQDAFEKAASGWVTPPRELCKGKRYLPGELVYLADLAMKTNPAERLRTAKAFHELLQGYLSGSSRRKEAHKIAKSIQSGLEKDTTYHQFSRHLARIEEARGLWPDLTGLDSLREKLLARYGNQALANGDLMLARSQAESLPESSADREELLNAVTRKERERQAIVSQRRWALRIAGVLAVLALAGGLLFYRQLSRANERLAAERDRGEELLAFMVEDLGDKLREFSRLDLMADMATQSLRYYESLPDGEIDDEASARRMRLFLEIAAVFRDQGEVSKAAQALANAKALLIRRSADGPLPPELQALFLALEREEERLLATAKGAPADRQDDDATSPSLSNDKTALRAAEPLGLESQP